MLSENIEVIRRAHAAFNRGDFATLREVAADEVEWGTTGAWAGIDSVYHGSDALVRWAEDIRSVWEVFEVRIDDVLYEAADSLVVVERLNGRGLGSGVDVEMRAFSAYWFRDGRIVKRKAFLDELPALDAVGLSEQDLEPAE
jgi:ketosteroid isomerase-like protein